MRRPDPEFLGTTVFFGAIALVSGALLTLVITAIVRDVAERDWPGLPILSVGFVLFGALLGFSLYILWSNLVAPHLPRRAVTEPNTAWMTEQLTALPFVTAATAAFADGTWSVTIEPRALPTDQRTQVLRTVWIESAVEPRLAVVNGVRTELNGLFSEQPSR
jgi:hypothetical protein